MNERDGTHFGLYLDLLSLLTPLLGRFMAGVFAGVRNDSRNE